MLVCEKPLSGYNNVLNVTFEYQGKRFSVTDWGSGYNENTRFKYYGSKCEYTPVPGLFMYSGCGGGNYYSKTGRIFSCSTTEAQMLAAIEEVEYQYKDSFAYHRSTYVGD